MTTRKLVSFDWAMKKLLRSKANFDILEGFLSELLNEDIRVLEILESESNKDHLRGKHNRVDLKVKNGQGEIVIVEVQHDYEWDYLQRILYSTSKVIAEHLEQGAAYSKIVKVISINIVYFDLGHGSDYVYHGTTSFKGLHTHDELQLDQKQQALYHHTQIGKIYPEYYLLKINQFNDVAKDSLDEWIYFLKNEEIKDHFQAKGLKKAKQALDILKLSDEERSVYEQYQQDMHYQASMVESSYGMGRLEGVQEGRKEGRKQGRREGIVQVALNMKQKGFALDAISQMTGLSIDEINRIEDLSNE